VSRDIRLVTSAAAINNRCCTRIDAMMNSIFFDAIE